MSNAIAQTILSQLGPGTLAMLGAKDLVALEDGLQFRIQGSRKVSKIVIKLEPSDTYTIEFWKGRGWEWNMVADQSFVYAESMHATIKTHTGLEVRL